MSLINRLERKFGRWAVPNITVLIIAGQVMLYVLSAMRGGQGLGGNVLAKLDLLPSAVMAGEIWRLVTFLFVPPPISPLFLVFYCMLFYRYGTALEQQWGVVRYNAFLLLGYLANLAAVFVAWGFGSDLLASNSFLYGTVFLAFARLFPSFVLNIFFILPIQIKWLALLAWIGYGYGLLTGSGMSRMLIVASVLNYLVFFGREHWRDFKSGQRRRSYQAKVVTASKQLAHQCLVCGLDRKTSPKTLFRYCSKCDGQCCYCPEHIHNHEHVVADEPDKAVIS
ncbi:MAG: rhomboid family intramembrane serine protease [Planctomycetes bacterium]|nr:rhomboid family intramembrane serine protease [Planctomycetota bacterium]